LVILDLFYAGFMAQALAAADSSVENPPLPVARPSQSPDQGREEDEKNVSKKGISESLGAAIDSADARKAYRGLLKREAEKNGLPPDIADAVAAIESGYDPGAIGGVGEIGLMQVRPGTAAMLGFKGDQDELARPEVNIHYGVTYLAEAWRLAKGDLCRALMKYRAGHGEEFMSPLSATYCGRARAHLAAIGSPFAAGASAPFVFAQAKPAVRGAKRGPRRGPKIRTVATSRAFWAAHEARVKAIRARIEVKWRKVASR
jgi:soluble lytic murein transglycosylase-like protein